MLFQNKKEKNYQQALEFLRGSEIKTREQAKAHMRQISIRGIFIAAVIVLLAGVALVMTESPANMYWLFFLSMLLIWVCGSAVGAIRVVRRYMREELK